MRVLIASGQVPFSARAVGSLAEALRSAVVETGHLAEIVRIPFGAEEIERVSTEILATRLLRFGKKPDEMLVALGYPAHLIQHPNKVIWLADLAYPHSFANGLTPSRPPASGLMDLRRDADRRAQDEAKKVFTYSTTLSRRWFEEFGVKSEILYPPPRIDGSGGDPAGGDFILVPAEEGIDDRLELILDALKKTRTEVSVGVVGRGSPINGGDRIREQIVSSGHENRWRWFDIDYSAESEGLINHARAVLSIPHEADDPGIAIAAMQSGRPIITTLDSGATAEFVDHLKTGWCVSPESDQLAKAMDDAWRKKRLARKLGTTGRKRFESLDLDWGRTVKRLLC